MPPGEWQPAAGEYRVFSRIIFKLWSLSVTQITAQSDRCYTTSIGSIPQVFRQKFHSDQRPDARRPCHCRYLVA
jgi:hypothetical protein